MRIGKNLARIGALSLLVILVLCTSCSFIAVHKDVASAIAQNQSLTLDIWKNGHHSKTEIIERKSKAYQEVLTWAQKNSEGWHITPASYAPMATISGSNFRLTILSDGVVFAEADYQYEKKLSRSSYDQLMGQLQ